MRLTATMLPGNKVRLSWKAVPGRRYEILYANSFEYVFYNLSPVLASRASQLRPKNTSMTPCPLLLMALDFTDYGWCLDGLPLGNSSIPSPYRLFL